MALLLILLCECPAADASVVTADGIAALAQIAAEVCASDALCAGRFLIPEGSDPASHRSEMKDFLEGHGVGPQTSAAILSSGTADRILLSMLVEMTVDCTAHVQIVAARMNRYYSSLMIISSVVALSAYFVMYASLRSKLERLANNILRTTVPAVR